MAKKAKVIVVGGGLGGLWAALRALENGHPVDLFSLFPVKRSHSCCAQGGINACMDTKGQNDSIWQHIVDTIKGGAYLSEQPPVKTMCEDAPGLMRTFDRMGVTFSRTPEGILDLRLFGGVKNKRTLFAGASSGQQLLYAVDEQVRAHEEKGLLTKYEWWEFLSIVKDGDGRCRGIVAMDLNSMETRAFKADAVVLATGGMGLVYNQSTNSTNSTGAAAARVYQQGAIFANAEFIQFHPTGMKGHDKHRLMSEASRGEGGRVWVPRKAGDTRDPKQIPEEERFYFLEEWYPAYGNTVPRDVASRAIWKVVRHMGLGLGGEDMVYLDLTHLPRDFLDRRLGGILEMYETFAGQDPRDVPMKIFPAVHYSMGGLWVDYEVDGNTGAMARKHPKNHQTNIPGLFAAGECDFQYHGANRLGANSLLSASFSGAIAGDAVSLYLASLGKSGDAVSETVVNEEVKKQKELNDGILKRAGGENPFALHKDLGKVMQDWVRVERSNQELDMAMEALQELKERAKNISLDDNSGWANASLPYARQVQDMIIMGEVVAKSARMRDECRGSHYKPEFELKMPDARPGEPAYDEYVTKWKANNARWLKHTMATHTDKGPEITYRPVNTSVLSPDVPRDYR
jgi:succinate dehydrogenase / fumarate reductase flavoprotein subunit